MEAKLTEIIYVSSATDSEIGDEELIEILRSARIKNASKSITGMLVFCNGCFLQVLEGRKSDLEPVFASICRDSRHRKICTLRKGPIAARSFAKWSMGFAHAYSEDLPVLPGLVEFFSRRMGLRELDADYAKCLLEFCCLHAVETPSYGSQLEQSRSAA